MAKRPFWRWFMREVHALLVMGGALSAEGILGGLDAELDAATGRFERITPGLLRWKLRQLIAERRPFGELPDGRFAVLAGEVPWDGESPAGGRAAEVRTTPRGRGWRRAGSTRRGGRLVRLLSGAKRAFPAAEARTVSLLPVCARIRP